LELERRKQHENKSWVVFWCLKRVSSAQEGHREKSKTVLESPGNKESNNVFKTFLCVVPGVGRGTMSWMWLTEARGIATL
jgi:hypothetical protein